MKNYKIENRKAFSLIEQMVAVAILSSGIVLIYGALLTSLNAFKYSSNRLNVSSWMNEKIWETQNKLICSGALIMGEYTGSFVSKTKNFDWKISVDLIGQAQESYLYRLALTVFWKEPQRDVSLSQVAYVQN